MRNLKEIIKDAEKKGLAIGHFNISDIGTLKAVTEAARELNAPVIIGTSEGEREFLDVHEAVALIKSLREEHEQEIFINADHTHSLSKAQEAVEAGYDAILFDGAKLPMEENIRQTKKIVEYVKSKSAGQEREILVEGELGYIGASSEILKEIPRGAAVEKTDLTTPEEAARFVKATGVDLFAPAVGNVHGMLENASNPRLDIERIRQIKQAAGVPLILHGGSGVKDEDFIMAIKAGISVIHISTELRLAWRKGVERGLQEKPEEVAPYKIMAPALDEIKKIVYNRLKLFYGASSSNKR
ncbi:MAG: class II fructose-bisphosphate aldolase [Patescibacteria group bacterium]